MKRFALILLACLCACALALAEGYAPADDLSDALLYPYDAENPDSPGCTYIYAYPQLEEKDNAAADINQFYRDKEAYDLDYEAPTIAEGWLPSGESVTVTVSYKTVCNNGTFFSVLFCRESVSETVGEHRVWSADTFVCSEASALAINLPMLLGTLAPREKDEWLQDRQVEKAEELVREMVWEQIEDNEQDYPFYDDLAEEDLELIFFPEDDFYLDENGNPVFYLQPGSAAPDEAGLLTFPIDIGEILDEL